MDPQGTTFSSLNPYEKLDFLEASTPQELLKMIQAYSGQIKILTIYSVGTNHIAWVQHGFQKLKKGK